MLKLFHYFEKYYFEEKMMNEQTHELVDINE